MMPEPQKRCTRRDLNDSNSDDELMISVFGTRRSSKRRKAKNEEAKKNNRMAQMNALLDNGRIKLEHESRMEKLRRQNNELIRIQNTEVENGTNKNSSSHDKSSKGNGSPLRREYQLKTNHYQQTIQAKSVKETSCLGSRNTLQLLSLVSTKTFDQPLSLFWFGIHEAFADLKKLLLADLQQKQDRSPFTPLRKEFFKLCSRKSVHDSCMYLRKRFMCEQKDQERIRNIPVDMLRWLMALACGPIANRNINGCVWKIPYRSGDTYSEQPQKLLRKDGDDGQRKDLLISQRLLIDAQTGAHQTLCRLWSQDLGFPFQEHHQDCTFLLSILALPTQLRQWFGSSFPIDSKNDGSENICTPGDRSNDQLDSSISTLPSPPSQVIISLIREDKDPLYITNSPTALVRFFQLWSICLQKQNDNYSTNRNVHLVNFHYDHKNRTKFQNNVSEAIIAVLWAGLNPSFASSTSAKDDGTKYINCIVGCLLERVRQEKFYYNSEHSVLESEDSFKQWLRTLSDRICLTWSKELGRGQKGTDAYDDENAWLCLARSVTRLVHIDDSLCERHGGMKDHVFGEGNISSMKAFKLCLCRCVIKHAFVACQNYHHLQLVDEFQEKEINEGNCDDWVSLSVNEEMQRLKVPFEIRSSQRWQAMCLSVVGLTKLATDFPDGEASKCFALMDICSDCFHYAILEIEIRKDCLKRNKELSDDSEDMHIMNGNAVRGISQNMEDVSEKLALYNAFVTLENASEIISNRTRLLLMQNVCFPWASHMAENLRNYVRSHKKKYTPLSTIIRAEPIKEQSRIITFFSKPRREREAKHQLIFASQEFNS